MKEVPVKVYRNDEIRRFRLDIGNNDRPAFQKLYDQVLRMFPNLANERVRLTWKDNDGERVRMSSDSELKEAIDNLPAEDQTLRVYLAEIQLNKMVQPEKRQQQDWSKDDQCSDTDEERPKSGKCEPATVCRMRHVGVVCDGCDGRIHGSRYKCLICPDYDLCSECVEVISHDEHPIIRIASPMNESWMAAFLAAQRSGERGCGGHDQCCQCQCRYHDCGEEDCEGEELVGNENEGAANEEANEKGPPPRMCTGAAASEKKIETALSYMEAMGYVNDGGYLKKLLKLHKGDVAAVLDVLHSNECCSNEKAY